MANGTGQTAIEPRLELGNMLMSRGIQTQPRTNLEMLGGLAQMLAGAKLRADVASDRTEQLSKQAGVVRELMSDNEQAGQLMGGMSDQSVAGLAGPLLQQAITPVEPIEVGGQLVNPQTGEVTFEGRRDPVKLSRDQVLVDPETGEQTAAGRRSPADRSITTVGVPGQPRMRQRVTVDEQTGEFIPVGEPFESGDTGPTFNFGEDGQGRAQVQPEDSLWEAAEGGTGLWSGLLEGASAVSGQMGGPVAEETIEKRQRLRTAAGDMVRSLSINPRMPVAEIRRIREQISLEPGVFDNEKAMHSRMRSIDNSLRRMMAQARNDAQNENLPDDTREAQASNASSLANFLDTMGVPRPLSADKIQNMPLENLQNAFDNASDADLEAMSDEALDILERRLSGGR